MPNRGGRTGNIDADLVVSLVKEGLATSEIAGMLGCSDTTIRTIRSDRGCSAPTGSVARLPWLVAKCRQCRRLFDYKEYKCHGRRMFCGIRCKLAWDRDQRRKLPKDGRTRRALLMRLYWKENRTTTEIAQQFGMAHRSVISAMQKLGIPRRKVGSSRFTVCKEPGCDKPIYKVFNKTNGSWYGRRCYLHWVVYRFNVNQPKGEQTWERRSRRLLNRARRLARAVSSTLNAASGPEWTSPT